MTRRLHAVPETDKRRIEAELRYWADFEEVIRGLHLFNSIGRLQREAVHLEKEAREAGLTAVAEELKVIDRALGKVRERTK